MSSLSRAVIDALFPEGPAWSPAADDDYDLLLEGVSDNSEAVRLDLDKLRYLRDPARTPILDDLESEFAVIPSATASEAQRRIRLASTMFRRSEQPTYEMLEEKLQGAGFDCYVYANDPAVDPSLYLEQNFNMVCGGLLPGGNESQCGEAEAYCAQSGGELLVNGEIFDTFPDFNCLCGEPLMQCGEADALCGSYTGILLIPIEYPIPDNSGYWPLIFFVGGLREWGLLGSRYSFQGCGEGANERIYSIALQTDGKIIIVGLFTTYNGVSRNRIARINVDGSLDYSFDPGTGANGFVYSAALQTDGKIIIAGIFTSYNGVSRNRIARLNTGGNLDATFDPGTGADADIREIALQSDGKIIISGIFTSYNGTSRNRIARLNTDGSLDATFDPGTGFNVAYAAAIAFQTDGKIIVGGYFTSYNGTGRNCIARLNTDGSLDATFDPGTGASAAPEVIAIQTDDQILIAGIFTSYNGTSRNRIARLNIDGSLDATFDPGSGANNIIYSLAIQTDDQILIGGNFTSYDGTARNRIARINADGSLDATFDPGSGANNYVFAISIQTDDKIIIAGQFISFDGDTANRIARLNTDGELDIVDVYGWSIASASIAIERRQEFRRIILKSKPMASWAGLIVVYV